MKKVLKIIGWILAGLLAIACVAWFVFLKPDPPPINVNDRAQINLMPLPAELKLSKGVFVLGTELSHMLTGKSGPRTEEALSRFYSKLKQVTGTGHGSGSGQQMILHCSQEEISYPSQTDDESYSIRITGNKIKVEAQSSTGIMYALESLLQLVREEGGQWVLPQLNLEDTPRYPWRGLMIDVCRHWIPKEVILRNLDAMASVKMNVLHLHLTEAQGFRIESKKYPKLHEMGSAGNYYTQEDIREIIDYAADRAIRVVPEFDVPGHTKAWFVGHPELASGPGPYQLDSSMMGSSPAMDPTRDEVYDFLDVFLGEMSVLFPDEYLHIGGDEVVPTQWNENPDIQAFMRENSLADSHELQAYFNQRLQKIVSAHDKIMLGWDEILHPELPPDGIAVQIWRNQESLWESARLGYPAILSAGYYLDHKQSASFHYQVDPTIIPGAVDIEIDSLNWKSWDCLFSVMDMQMDGGLFLFGEGDDLRGIMQFMGGSAGFTEANLEGKLLTYTVDMGMGDMEFRLLLQGDSLSGSSKISVFNLDVSGSRVGGTDMEEGLSLPVFKKIVPLTPDQEARLIGGEACMWTEMVDEHTIDSRIWPRAAAVAEKLWSPKVLTDNVDDMYRRLWIFNENLSRLGVQHVAYRDKILSALVDEHYLEPLSILTGLLQEDKLFGRMSIYEPMFYWTTPLNRMVDAAAPESYQAFRFGQDVDYWIESNDQEAYERILAALNTWAINHEKLLPAIAGNKNLMEVEKHSLNLSVMADLGLRVLQDPSSFTDADALQDEFFLTASEPRGGTLLAPVPHVQKLLQSAVKK